MTRDISTIELPDDILELLPGGDRTTEKALLDDVTTLLHGDH